MGSAETTPRERLVAVVAVLRGALNDGVETSWKGGEEYVASMEAEPERPRACPCCTKLVVICLKHYQLHEHGKPCIDCRREP